MITIVEKDDRLILQFHEPQYYMGPTGQMSVSAMPQLMQEIDITTHIERAVQNVLLREKPKADVREGITTEHDSH